MGSHNAKREDFSARLLPGGDIFKLEEVGVEIHWGFQRKVTRQRLPDSWPRSVCVCVCVCCKDMGQADTWKNHGGSQQNFPNLEEYFTSSKIFTSGNLKDDQRLQDE